MKLKAKGIKEEDAKWYKCEWYEVLTHKRSCFFCKHCTSIFWDYTNGPYWFFCDKDLDTTVGFKGECREFEEDNDGTRCSIFRE